MRRYDYRSPAEAKARGPADVVKEIRRFGGFATAEVAERFLRYAEALTPIGGVMSKTRKGRTPGTMQRSWRLFAVTSTEGRAWGVGNIAPHGLIINMGRRRNKFAYRVRRVGKYFRRGGHYMVPPGRRFIGSRLAPGGVTRPTWRRLKREEEAVSRIAIARADGGS